MEYTTCKDSVMELISDGSKVFGRDYKISEEMLSKIEERTKTLRIVIVCDELELHGGRTNGFFELITKLNSFSFSKQGREFIKIELNISNVWERMSE